MLKEINKVLRYITYITEELYFLSYNIITQMDKYMNPKEKETIYDILNEVYGQVNSLRLDNNAPILLTLTSRGELFPTAYFLHRHKNENKTNFLVYPWVISYKNYHKMLEQINEKEILEEIYYFTVKKLISYFKKNPYKDSVMVKIDEATTFGSCLFITELLYEVAKRDKNLLPKKIIMYDLTSIYYRNDCCFEDLIKIKNKNLKKVSALVKRINEIYGEEKIVHHSISSPSLYDIPWQDNTDYYSKINLFYFFYPLYNSLTISLMKEYYKKIDAINAYTYLMNVSEQIGLYLLKRYFKHIRYYNGFYIIPKKRFFNDEKYYLRKIFKDSNEAFGYILDYQRKLLIDVLKKKLENISKQKKIGWIFNEKKKEGDFVWLVKKRKKKLLFYVPSQLSEENIADPYRLFLLV